MTKKDAATRAETKALMRRFAETYRYKRCLLPDDDETLVVINLIGCSRFMASDYAKTLGAKQGEDALLVGYADLRANSHLTDPDADPVTLPTVFEGMPVYYHPRSTAVARVDS